MRRSYVRLSARAVQLTIGTAAALIVLTGGVWASHGPFTDVPNGNVHHDAIEAIRSAGVTLGCTPTRYCPRDFVRRDQMASFLDRLGALSPGRTPVVNAKTAQTADTVGGLAPGALVGAGVHVALGADGAPVVDGWFNNVNGTQPTVSQGADGMFEVDLGFDSAGTFVQCTTDASAKRTSCTASGDGDAYVVHTFGTGAMPDGVPFWLLVYGLAS